MDLVWNSEKRTVADVLKACIAQANKIDIAVAFLNSKGLSYIEEELQAALDRGCAVRLFAGTDFYLTDPKALRSLEVTFKHYDSSRLFLVGQSTSNTFHPKLYAFEDEGTITVIIGSANLTQGGLSDNREVCCILSAPPASELHERVNLLLSGYEGALDVREATVWEIERYAAAHRAFHKQVKGARKKAEKEIETIPQMDEAKLQACLDKYRSSEKEQDDYQRRQANYQVAHELLDQLASGEIVDGIRFADIWRKLIGSPGLWHSDGLYRRGHEAVRSFDKVCRLVRAIRGREDMPPGELFELGRQYTSRITGLGPNALTEMLNTYYPDDCAVLNKNPLTALSYFGLRDFPRQSAFAGKDYERFNRVIAYVKDLCGFESMGRADHFLNFVYWRVKRGKAC